MSPGGVPSSSRDRDFSLKLPENDLRSRTDYLLKPLFEASGNSVVGGILSRKWEGKAHTENPTCLDSTATLASLGHKIVVCWRPFASPKHTSPRTQISWDNRTKARIKMVGRLSSNSDHPVNYQNAWSLWACSFISIIRTWIQSILSCKTDVNIKCMSPPQNSKKNCFQIQDWLKAVTSFIVLSLAYRDIDIKMCAVLLKAIASGPPLSTSSGSSFCFLESQNSGGAFSMSSLAGSFPEWSFGVEGAFEKCSLLLPHVKNEKSPFWWSLLPPALLVATYAPYCSSVFFIQNRIVPWPSSTTLVPRATQGPLLLMEHQSLLSTIHTEIIPFISKPWLILRCFCEASPLALSCSVAKNTDMEDQTPQDRAKEKLWIHWQPHCLSPDSAPCVQLGDPRAATSHSCISGPFMVMATSKLYFLRLWESLGECPVNVCLIRSKALMSQRGDQECLFNLFASQFLYFKIRVRKISPNSDC